MFIDGIMIKILILIRLHTLYAHSVTLESGLLHDCTWIPDVDYRGINNTHWHVSAKTKEECCEVCQKTDGCKFAVFNPQYKSCWFKTASAVQFHSPGDMTCCPQGEISCPSAPPGPGSWNLLQDFSDEFPVEPSGRSVLPLNFSKWNTSVTSWGNWTWSSDHVHVVSALPKCNRTKNSTELPGSFLAITMSYEKHNRSGKTYYYKSGIAKSILPAGVTYGRFEARIKGASRWPGVCPAFWAWRHSTEYWIELDFVEMLENLTSAMDIDFTSHVFPPTPGVEKHISNSTHALMNFDPRDDFHVYAMEWNVSTLVWWVDGKVVKQLPSGPYFNESRAMDIALSFGLRHPLRDSPSAEGFPTTFFVDWVRVWQKE